jgi:hypothetical protein
MSWRGSTVVALFALGAACSSSTPLQPGSGTDGGGAGGSAGLPGTTGAAGATALPGPPTGTGGGQLGGIGGAAGPSDGGLGGAGGMVIMHGALGPSQSWTGYVENFTFWSGSDQIKLDFATDSNGVAAGTIVFGMGAPPAPATNPNVGYPPGVGGGGLGGNTGSERDSVAEGYTYQFDGGSFDSQRLRFTVLLSQLWSGWCALQTPPSDGSQGCFPNGGGGKDSSGCYVNNQGAMVAFDCSKFFLCVNQQPCLCDQSGCRASPSSPITQFDLFLSAGTMSGSAVGSFAGNVHFVKN